MNETTPAPRACEICGGPLRRDNSVGICTLTPGCAKANIAAHQKAKGSKPQRRITIDTGEVFGCWTALEDHHPRGGRMVLCRCECGREKPVPAFQIVSGTSRSCGCAIGKAALEAARLAEAIANPYVRAGDRFGLLVALEDGPFAKTVIAYRCDCGIEKQAIAGNLRRNMNSCGHTRAAALSISKQSHGLSKHPLYGTWYNAVYRCHGPKAAEYPDWGGRGIQVYEPWRSDVAAFIDWIEANLGPRPAGRYPSGQPFYTIDRINVDGNYEPGNVRWADKKTQAENRRRVGSVTSQRDAALAEVKRLKRLLGS